mmetsp:Transcript_59034/g.149556  ORF Transcript_59034/g.149556 Transcript_59034/m.149556 type:complete len:205 (-) Transcript_59034:4181-4795(-)
MRNHGLLEVPVSIQTRHVHVAQKDGQPEGYVRRGPHKGTPFRRQAPARGDIARPSLLDLCHDVVPNDFRLEDKQQEGAREELSEPSAKCGLERSLHPDLREEWQRSHDEEEKYNGREPRREHMSHGLGSGCLAIRLVEGRPMTVAISTDDQEPCEHQDGHAFGDEVLSDVVTCMCVVKRQALWKLQQLTQSQHLACQYLLPGAI